MSRPNPRGAPPESAAPANPSPANAGRPGSAGNPTILPSNPPGNRADGNILPVPGPGGPQQDINVRCSDLGRKIIEDLKRIAEEINGLQAKLSEKERGLYLNFVRSLEVLRTFRRLLNLLEICEGVHKRGEELPICT